MLAVPKDSEIDSIDDLTKEGTTVVVGSESVPIGAYTRETLAKLPPGQEKAILANVRSNEPDVKGIVGKLTQGAADAGFVYVTDVNATGGELKAIDLPADLEPQVTYGAGVVTKAEQPELAQKFVDGLTDGDCARRPERRRLRPGAVTRRAWFPALLLLCLAAALTFLTLPVVAIFVDSSPADLVSSLGEPGALDALWLSLKATAASIAIILLVGTPAAYLLATRSFRGRALVVTLIELPLVLPPAVAGIALLASRRARAGSSAARSRPPGSSSRSPRRVSSWRSPSSRRRSTYARPWPPSRRWTGRCSTPRARSVPPRRAASCA